jgi:hypothetical protein
VERKGQGGGRPPLRRRAPSPSVHCRIGEWQGSRRSSVWCDARGHRRSHSRGGNIARPEPAETLPSRVHQPSLGCRHRPIVGRTSRRWTTNLVAPTVEVPSGRAGVDENAAPMLGPVADDVNDCIPHFARRLEGMSMVTIRPDAAAGTEELVQAFRNANGEALHALSEASPIVRLDEQMDVVGLDAEVKDADELLLRGADPRKNAAKHRFRAKAG